MLSAQDHCPFEGVMNKGWVVQTIIRGNLQFENGKLVGDKQGEFIKRPTALHQ
jgi:dihydropyrimidinase/allantoinase